MFSNAMKECLPATAGLSANKKETTMRQVTLTVLAFLLISATAQAATTERRHARTKDHATVERTAGWEQWRNSNAYAAPGDTSVQSEGAMTSGIAGR
jgi:hypothetical protein